MNLTQHVEGIKNVPLGFDFSVNYHKMADAQNINGLARRRSKKTVAAVQTRQPPTHGHLVVLLARVSHHPFHLQVSLRNGSKQINQKPLNLGHAAIILLANAVHRRRWVVIVRDLVEIPRVPNVLKQVINQRPAVFLAVFSHNRSKLSRSVFANKWRREKRLVGVPFRLFGQRNGVVAKLLNQVQVISHQPFFLNFIGRNHAVGNGAEECFFASGRPKSRVSQVGGR